MIRSSDPDGYSYDLVVSDADETDIWRDTAFYPGWFHDCQPEPEQTERD